MTSAETPIWCPCGDYRALPHKRLCPVCLDSIERDRKDKK